MFGIQAPTTHSNVTPLYTSLMPIRSCVDGRFSCFAVKTYARANLWILPVVLGGVLILRTLSNCYRINEELQSISIFSYVWLERDGPVGVPPIYRIFDLWIDAKFNSTVDSLLWVYLKHTWDIHQIRIHQNLTCGEIILLVLPSPKSLEGQGRVTSDPSLCSVGPVKCKIVRVRVVSVVGCLWGEKKKKKNLLEKTGLCTKIVFKKFPVQHPCYTLLENLQIVCSFLILYFLWKILGNIINCYLLQTLMIVTTSQLFHMVNRWHIC